MQITVLLLVYFNMHVVATLTFVDVLTAITGTTVYCELVAVVIVIAITVVNI